MVLYSLKDDGGIFLLKGLLGISIIPHHHEVEEKVDCFLDDRRVIFWLPWRS